MNRMSKKIEERVSEEHADKIAIRRLIIFAGIMAAAVVGVVAITAWVVTPEVEAAPALPVGYVETWQAGDGTLVHKFCDKGTAIYVTPAASGGGGNLGGAGIEAIKNTYACR